MSSLARSRRDDGYDYMKQDLEACIGCAVCTATMFREETSSAYDPYTRGMRLACLDAIHQLQHTCEGATMIDIKLGDKVNDIITGFTGIATARYSYINGCVRYEVTEQKLREGKFSDITVDEGRLEIVEKGVILMDQDKASPDPPGGPRDTPSRPAIPTRADQSGSPSTGGPQPNEPPT